LAGCQGRNSQLAGYGCLNRPSLNPLNSQVIAARRRRDPDSRRPKFVYMFRTVRFTRSDPVRGLQPILDCPDERTLRYEQQGDRDASDEHHDDHPRPRVAEVQCVAHADAALDAGRLLVHRRRHAVQRRRRIGSVEIQAAQNPRRIRRGVSNRRMMLCAPSQLTSRSASIVSAPSPRRTCATTCPKSWL
jgi:hypothetical protein